LILDVQDFLFLSAALKNIVPGDIQEDAQIDWQRQG